MICEMKKKKKKNFGQRGCPGQAEEATQPSPVHNANLWAMCWKFLSS